MRHVQTIAIVAFVTVVVGCNSPVEPPEIMVYPDNHHDLELVTGGELLPVYIGKRVRLKACIQPPPQLDTTQWYGTLIVDEGAVRQQDYAESTTRMRVTLCFEVQVPESLSEGRHQLTLNVVDRYSDLLVGTWHIPFVHRGQDAKRAELRRTLREHARALGGSHASPEVVKGIETVAEDARTIGLWGTYSRAAAMAAYTLRRQGSDTSRARARNWVEQIPPEFAHPAAAAARAELAYEAANLAIDEQRSRLAWSRLLEAEKAYEHVADSRILPVWMKQAELIAGAGARREASARLRESLQECADDACASSLVASVESTLAWMVATDPYATEAELDEAVALAERPQNTNPETIGVIEHANEQVNLALLQSRRGVDASAWLDRAEALVASAGVNSQSKRADTVRDWIAVIRAENEWMRGRPGQAFDSLTSIRRDKQNGERVSSAVAWSYGIEARALRDLGDLEGAWRAVRRGLDTHLQTRKITDRSRRVTSADRATEDRLVALTLAIDRGKVGDAWKLMEELDSQTDLGRVRSSQVQQEDLRQKLDTLQSLETPASLPRAAQRAAVHRSLRNQIADQRSAGSAPETFAPATIDYRVIPTDQEVFILQAVSAKGYRLYRRTAMSRTELVSGLGRLTRLMESENSAAATSDQWREIAGPLAEALLPDASDLAPVTRFALHGVAQRAPLAGLPVGDRWLHELTTPIIVPVGSPTSPTESREQRSRVGVFVIDPASNLSEAKRGASRYRSWFPNAAILIGNKADAETITDHLRGSEFLHIDGHVKEDGVFPELSGVLLENETWRLLDLPEREQAYHFVNLSACRSAASEPTADRGGFGLAGWLVASHADWVIGATTDLWDDSAALFNNAFYETIYNDGDVSAAYRAGLSAVTRHQPPQRWASLVLLGIHQVDGEEGQP